MGTGRRVKSFPRAFPPSNDVPVLLLNQPNTEVRSSNQKLSLISPSVGIKAATFPLKEAKIPSGREGSVEWDLYTVS